MSVYALITARCGSKRIPNKNIRTFLDIGPIITIPIKALLACDFISEVFVDTDCEEIARISRDAGASVPHLRPPHLADDFATTLQVVKAAIKRWGFNQKDSLLVVYPTSLLTTDHYQRAWEEFAADETCMLVSICSLGIPISRILALTGNSIRIGSKEIEALRARTQDHEVGYKDAGKFYLSHVGSWLETKNIFEDARAHIIEPEFGIDIDTESDWNFAETVYRGMRADPV